MFSLYFRKSVGALMALITLAFSAPQAVFAASLAAPTNLELEGGIYTNDTTPTFSWSQSSGATWYEYAIDANGSYTLGNVDSYTSATLADGWHTFFLWAHDNNNNQSASASITFEIDTVGPTVPQVSPSSATEDEAVTFYVYPYGEAAPTSCTLYVEGESVGSMSNNGGTFSKSYTFSWDGSYTVYAKCTDGDGNTTSGSSRTVTVDDNNDDEDETFVVPAVSPSSAVEDEEVTFKVTPYGDLDAESCKLYVNGSYVGSMSESSGTFSRDYTFSKDGEYTVYAYCEDERGDWTKGTSRTVEVDNANTSGALYVPKVTPSSADEDERTEFTVRPESDHNVTDCWLYVDDVREEEMDEESTNVFVAEYTFTQEGEYDVHAYCKDSSGDTDTGDERTVTVGDGQEGNEADRGSLIKTECGASSSASDPCRAVYYYDERGDRHAFPNESTYFTWFSDFDDVIEVSEDFMASLDLGDNVTYRPGSVLVKFDTSAKVYAIEAEHMLRHYESASLVEADYGEDWGEVLVSLPDTLYKNYDIGEEIDSKYDFDRTDAYYSVDSIEDIF